VKLGSRHVLVFIILRCLSGIGKIVYSCTIFCYISSLQFCNFYLCGGIGQNGPRPHRFEVPSSHTIRHTHPTCRTPLYEGSARRSGRYLHNIQKNTRRLSHMQSARFEPAFALTTRPQTYGLAQYGHRDGKMSTNTWPNSKLHVFSHLHSPEIVILIRMLWRKTSIISSSCTNSANSMQIKYK